MPAHDNDGPLPPETAAAPDPYGRAALLLVESLIHGLCEKSALSVGEAVEIAERAVSVQFEQASAMPADGTYMWRSHALLSSIATSLKIDEQRGTPLRPV